MEIELREAQEKYYSFLYWKNKTEEEELKINLNKAEKEYKEIQINLEQVNELADLARSSSRQDNFNDLQNRHQEAVREKNGLERNIAILDGQMHAEYSQRGSQNIGWLENKIKELVATRENLKHQAEIAENECKKFEIEINKLRKELDNLHSPKSGKRLCLSVNCKVKCLKVKMNKTFYNFPG